MSIFQNIDLCVNIGFHRQKRKSVILGVAGLLFLFVHLIFLCLFCVPNTGFRSFSAFVRGENLQCSP